MKLLFKSALLLLIITLVSFSYIIDIEKLKGKWISAKDPNWTLYFFDDYYLNSYLENQDTVLYKVSNHCLNMENSSSIKKNDFFINTYNKNSHDSICFEILSLSDSTLSLMETSRGYLFLFNKVN